jgi:hypothetical protein
MHFRAESALRYGEYPARSYARAGLDLKRQALSQVFPDA